MVFLHIQPVDDKAIFLANPPKYLLGILGHLSHEYLLAILGNPDEMVLDVIDGMAASSWCAHVLLLQYFA